MSVIFPDVDRTRVWNRRLATERTYRPKQEEENSDQRDENLTRPLDSTHHLDAPFEDIPTCHTWCLVAFKQIECHETVMFVCRSLY